MSLLDVFDTIVDIMHHDYAGFEDKKGWDEPEAIRERLVALIESGGLTRPVFEELVNDYLLYFQDDHNALRSVKQDAPPQSVGFQVRHYENLLYVEKVNQEQRIEKGTRISEIDGVPVNTIADLNRRLLKSSIPEREWWENVLLKAKQVTVVDNLGKSATLVLKSYDNPRKPSNYQFEMIEGVAVFHFNDFLDNKQMEKLLETHRSEIDSASQWIIDVRECRGGSDSVYFPLLDGIFQPDPEINSDDMNHLVTERNYVNRMRSFAAFNDTDDPFIQAFIKQMDLYRGKGFVTFDFSEFEEDFPLKGSTHPSRIIVITDKFCGSSGEEFVLTCRQSEKVTVIGRPTRGVLDYSNQAIEHFEEEEYDFVYATSRSERVERGTGIDFKGITPDQYIPWTPEHLKRDVDLEQAFNLLKIQK